MRATLLARVRETLARAGFYLSQDAALRPLSFDLVARRDGQLLLVKVLTNVDGLSEPVAKELRVISRFLDARAIVVGERSSSRTLEDGAVYLRHGINIVTPATLDEYLIEGVEPLVVAAPGGFYVRVDGRRLRELREARGLSLGDLAQAAGVSRRAIGMYEEGMSAMVDVAMRLETFLDEALAIPANPFVPQPDTAPPPAMPTVEPQGFEGIVYRHLTELGFHVVPTAKSPFSAIGRESSEHVRRATEGVVLTGIGEASPDLDKRAAATANLCDVTETHGVFFVKRTTTRVAIEGTPVVSRSELGKVEAPEDLLRLLAERRGKRR